MLEDRTVRREADTQTENAPTEFILNRFENDAVAAAEARGGHARQEQVFDRLKTSYDKQPYAIRRMLTEGAVRACDKRAQFIGLEAYVEAGGIILRDLFQGDDGGWLQDVALVDRLAAEKLKVEADAVTGEGWKWVEMAPDFAYDHTYGLRQMRGETILLTAEEETCRDALQAEYDRLSTEYAKADELPEEVDARLGELGTAIKAFEARSITFDPAEVARAGAFVSIAHDGTVRIERGYTYARSAPSEGTALAAGDRRGCGTTEERRGHFIGLLWTDEPALRRSGKWIRLLP